MRSSQASRPRSDNSAKVIALTLVHFHPGLRGSGGFCEFSETRGTVTVKDKLKQLSKQDSPHWAAWLAFWVVISASAGPFGLGLSAIMLFGRWTQVFGTRTCILADVEVQCTRQNIYAAMLNPKIDALRTLKTFSFDTPQKCLARRHICAVGFEELAWIIHWLGNDLEH